MFTTKTGTGSMMYIFNFINHIDALAKLCPGGSRGGSCKQAQDSTGTHGPVPGTAGRPRVVLPEDPLTASFECFFQNVCYRSQATKGWKGKAGKCGSWKRGKEEQREMEEKGNMGLTRERGDREENEDQGKAIFRTTNNWGAAIVFLRVICKSGYAIALLASLAPHCFFCAHFPEFVGLVAGPQKMKRADQGKDVQSKTTGGNNRI